MQRMQCFCIEMTKEQENLSEVEEPEETSGTECRGVHLSLRALMTTRQVQLSTSIEPGAFARVWLHHVRRHQMHLVKQVVNKGVHEREAQGRICGSAVQQGVMFGREIIKTFLQPKASDITAISHVYYM